MTLDQPRLALAASPREWAQQLHRHVADHGGALVRATVLSPRDALGEGFDVFIVDDSTSFLSRRLVEDLHRRGRSVLGVFDPDDPRGKGELIDAGVDDVIERGAGPEAFLAAVRGLASRLPSAAELDGGESAAELDGGDRPAATARRQESQRPADGAAGGGGITVVAGAGAGVGATEIALGLAHASGQRGHPTALVDADDVAPCLAQRLGVPPYPNIRAALDAMQQRTGTIDDVVRPLRAGRFSVLPGLASGRSWDDLRPGEVGDLLRGLARVRPQVVVNVGPRIEDLAGGVGSAPRHGLPRHLLSTADRVVVVAGPTPVGVARLLEWLADADTLLAHGPSAIVFDRAPADRFRRGEIIAELERSAVPARAWFVPTDLRVADAAWRGTLVAHGPFTRAVDTLAEALLPAGQPARRRRWRR